MNRLHRLFAPACLAASVAACGGGGGSNDSASSPPPPASPSTPPAATAFQAVTCPDSSALLVAKSITIAGQTRNYLVAVPTQLAALRASDVKGVAVVMSFSQNGESAKAGATTTCWHDIGEREGFVAVYPEAASATWNTTLDASKPDDIAFVKALVPALKSEYGLGGLNNVYLTGVGAGARMANAVAIMAPTIETIAAVAGVDGVAEAAVLAQPAGNRPASTMASWIIQSAGSTSDVSAQIAYWNSQNGVLSAGVSSRETGLPATVYANKERPLQQVRVTTLTVKGYGGKQLSEDIWAGMFAGTYRFPDDTRTNGTLNPNRSIADMKLLDTTKEFVAGSPRRWLTYLPSNYAALTAGGQRLPLVISLHGRNGSAKYQALTTKWHEVAESNGFIVAYPQGNGATWNTTIADPNVDVQFIMSLVDELKAKYAVDSTRVFLNGTSMGAALTNRIAVQYPVPFAAIAPCYSGHLSPANYAAPIVRTDVPMPVWQCRGQDELPTDFPGGTAGEAAAQVFWRETVNHNTGLPAVQLDGRKVTQIWNNGAAEYRWQVTEYQPHFWHEGEAAKLWNEMFSKYSRNSAGALVKAP